MISNKIKVVLTASVAGAAYLFAGTVATGPHNLSAVSGMASSTLDNGEICVYCHTPHAANTDFTGAPLWNKATPAGTFTTYGITIAGTTASTTVAKPSMACLSCHDGASAVDSIINAPGSGSNTITGTKNITNYTGTVYGGNIGTALGNDHPVSIEYIEGRAGLRNWDTNLTSLGDFAAWVGATTIKDLLRGTTKNQVECGSCHDPHNGDHAQSTSTEVNFLRHSNTNSNLCLGCHAK